MTTFRKRLLTSVVAVGLAAGSYTAYANRPDWGPMGGMPTEFGEHRKSPERMKERFEKRQSELHDKLKLNANQEGAWKAYLEKMRPTDLPNPPDRAEIAKLSAPERMEKMLGFMREREKRMTEHVAATKAFYAVLTPEQQKIFNEAFSAGHRRHGGSH